jgi:capsular exopolysaccharide synthesis family protein
MTDSGDRRRMQRTWRDGLQVAPSPPSPPATVRDGHEPHGEAVLDVAWRILRRHWLIVLQAVVVTAVAAALFSSSRENQYTASASLLFGAPSENILGTGGFVDETRQAATNEELLKLGVVADLAASDLDGRATAAQIRDSISVVGEPDANLLEVRSTTSDPTLSAVIANTYSRAFIEFRQLSQRDQLQDAINLARDGLAALSERQREGSEGEALNTRIQQLETAKSLQTGGAELVQTASRPTSPSSPKPTRDGILGGMLGLIFGFGMAALRERFDRAVKSIDELEGTTGWPVLARVPRSRRIARRDRLAPRSAEAEAFRMLRASLRYFSIGDDEVRSLLVTSALPGEGKSTTARGLADTMVAMGARVVLVEADMHRGGRQLSLDMPGGLSGALTGQELDEVLLEVPVGANDELRMLTVLPSGPLPPNPSELLESRRMRQLLETLQSEFDIVIIDSPPLGLLSDAMTLVNQVSGVVVVAAIGKVGREEIREFANQLARLHANVLGAVANFAPGVDKAKGYYQRH